ncbi:hypothetical protein D3C71_924900 [compost metagenome]
MASIVVHAKSVMRHAKPARISFGRCALALRLFFRTQRQCYWIAQRLRLTTNPLTPCQSAAASCCRSPIVDKGLRVSPRSCKSARSETSFAHLSITPCRACSKSGLTRLKKTPTSRTCETRSLSCRNCKVSSRGSKQSAMRCYQGRRLGSIGKNSCQRSASALRCKIG